MAVCCSGFVENVDDESIWLCDHNEAKLLFAGLDWEEEIYLKLKWLWLWFTAAEPSVQWTAEVFGLCIANSLNSESDLIQNSRQSDKHFVRRCDE